NSFDKPVVLDGGGNPTSLALAQSSPGVYEYDTPLFFPVDNLGWNAGADPQTDLGTDGVSHNFSFTSELHEVFTYQASASPTLGVTATGDTWIFINRHLAIDLGGIHGASPGSVTLDAATAANLGLSDG